MARQLKKERDICFPSGEGWAKRCTYSWYSVLDSFILFALPAFFCSFIVPLDTLFYAAADKNTVLHRSGRLF